jgi:hypothetical protein
MNKKFKLTGKIHGVLLLISLTVFNVSCQNKGHNKYDIAAYYCPTYHPDPRYKEMGIFPDGKGEWEVIYEAKPKIPGHELPKVPLWGYEDESDPVVMAKKIDTAVKYGVNVMIFDWYWYDNRPFLEDALNKGFLKAKNSEKMKFWLMWANHDMDSYINPDRHGESKLYWPGEVDRETFEEIVDHVVNDYFKKSNYYTINGEPVFAIYELSTFINGLGGPQKAKEALDYFEEKTIEAGFPGLHLQAILWGLVPSGLEGVPGDVIETQSSTIEYFGFKSMTNYHWCHFIGPNGDYVPFGEKAIKLWEKWDTTFVTPFLPHVSMGWDNNPRSPQSLRDFITNNKPEYFQKFLLKAKEYVDDHPLQPRLITVNAWNEWAESSYLEPDTVHKFGYLEAIKEVFINTDK